MRANGWVRACLIAAVALTAGAAAAQDEIAQFYRGKQITMIVGSSAGGGYDIYARLVARHLGKYIPGNPSIVPQNMPGAGSNKAAAYVYAVAPKDGTAIGAIFPGAVMDPLLDERAQAGHDPSKFVYVGSASTDVFICMVRSDVPIRSFQDVLAKEVILGASAEGGSTKNFPAVLVNILGAKYRLVSGYPGTREITLALERNEVQGVCGMSWSSISAQHPDWFAKGVVRALAQEHAIGHPALNRMGVPLTVDFAKSPADRRVMELIYSQQVFGRPYVLPPGVPAERVGALRKAFDQMMQDKELLAEAEKMKLDISPITGEELQEIIGRIYRTPPEIIARARDALVYKGGK